MSYRPRHAAPPWRHAPRSWRLLRLALAWAATLRAYGWAIGGTFVANQIRLFREGPR